MQKEFNRNPFNLLLLFLFFYIFFALNLTTSFTQSFPPFFYCLQIVEYTSPTDADFDPLQQALGKAETLCEHVNDGVQQKENTEKLEWLQSHVQFVNLDENIEFNSQTNFMGPRKLLHWGKFFKVSIGICKRAGLGCAGLG